jgi:anhydro-N-acetylmuramic acid kinase
VSDDPLTRLLGLRTVSPRRVIGLISGTSADGIDVALVELEGAGETTRARLLDFHTRPYDSQLRPRVLALKDARADELLRCHYRLGEEFAQAALGMIEAARGKGLAVHLIGSHGQTARHHPRADDSGGRAATLQIGEPAIIAERTGLPVVADFRPRDIAAGGEGAPLVPLVDWLLFRQVGATRACLNMGGIANVTIVTERVDSVRAFDLGPANMPLDFVVQHWTGGAETFDRDGRHAAAGRVDLELVAELLRHQYFELPPPKSTGREAFGDLFVEPLLARYAGREADLLASLTRFVAASVGGGIRRWVREPLSEVLVSGGGARNPTLMAELAAALAPVPVRSLAEVGLDPDAKEAVAFAVLANETLFGRAGNVPRATGATGPRVLGKLVL